MTGPQETQGLAIGETAAPGLRKLRSFAALCRVTRDANPLKSTPSIFGYKLAVGRSRVGSPPAPPISRIASGRSTNHWSRLSRSRFQHEAGRRMEHDARFYGLPMSRGFLMMPFTKRRP